MPCYNQFKQTVACAKSAYVEKIDSPLQLFHSYPGFLPRTVLTHTVVIAFFNASLMFSCVVSSSCFLSWRKKTFIIKYITWFINYTENGTLLSGQDFWSEFGVRLKVCVLPTIANVCIDKLPSTCLNVHSTIAFQVALNRETSCPRWCCSLSSKTTPVQATIHSFYDSVGISKW